MPKSINVEVFNDTKKKCKTNVKLINSYNPLHNDDLIYTPDVTFFKSDTSRPELLPEKDWTKVDVISCSAPYLGGFKPGTALKKVNISNEDLLKLHEKRLR